MSKKNISKACLYCGKEFLTNRPGAKFCDWRCYNDWRKNQTGPSPRQVSITCDYCGKRFVKWKYRIVKGKQNFCSRKCAACSEQSPEQWTEQTCEICGRKFIIQTWFIIVRGHGKYCSKVCQNRALSLNYRGAGNPHWRGGHEPYYGPNWPSQRKKAYKRDNRTCRMCGKRTSKTPDVHHIKPFREFGYVRDVNDHYLQANGLQNLICLCRPCHAKAEKGEINLQPALL